MWSNLSFAMIDDLIRRPQLRIVMRSLIPNRTVELNI